MKTYLYSFAIELSSCIEGWSMDYVVTTEAGNKKAAADQVYMLLADGDHHVKIKYVNGSRKLVT